MKTQLKFLKKFESPRNLLGAACILLAVIISYSLYAAEYKFTPDTKTLSAAITEYNSQDSHPVNAYVLEAEEASGTLIVFFKDKNHTNVFGFARLLKGINGKYRLVRSSYGPISYSAVNSIYEFETRKGKYYAVGGYNLDKNISAYGLRILDQNNSDKIGLLKFDVANSQFLELHKASNLQKNIKSLFGEIASSYIDPHQTSLLNSEGKEITENYKITISNGDWSAGTSTAELIVLYIAIAMILIFGSIMGMAFWASAKK